MHLRFLGIDPGANGSACILDPSTRGVQFYKVPSNKYTARDFVDEVWSNNRYTNFIAAVEDVHSLHGMSAKSNFTFGFNLGMIHATLQAMGIPFQEVQPKVWQKACGLPTQKFLEDYALKQAVADVAEMLYPEAELHGPKGGLLDGRSDALMIAHWLFKQQEKANGKSVSEGFPLPS